MSRLLLVRHGQAAAGWESDPDPGLDEVGRRQAKEMAETVGQNDPRPLLTSPRRRARETAEALADQWRVEAIVDPGVGDVEAPAMDPAQRGPWLRSFMAGTWEDKPQELLAWRQRVVAKLLDLGAADCVVVTHFFPINIAVGEATGDPRVVCFAPDNCSVTEVAIEDGKFRVVQMGREDRTVVQ